MRYAIISDVHSNLEALKVVLFELERESPDRKIFLGDVVGYGPDPNECINEIKKNADIALIGNHDHAAIGLTDIVRFNPYAREAIEWTMERLSKEDKDYLSGWPLTESIDDMFFVHSSPKRPLDWNYISTEQDFMENFDYFYQRICFIGHSHKPVITAIDNYGRLGILGNEVVIGKYYRYIINVGSVGQPRDCNPDASYVMYDTDKAVVTIKRVGYNYCETQEKMKRAGLPSYLIDRLSIGR